MAALCLSCAGIFVSSVRKMLLGLGVCPLCASAVLLLTVWFAAGCGGGSAERASPAPVAVPADFSLVLSTNSVLVAQGSTSSAVTISVNAQHSFDGSVQVSLSGLPAGVISYPGSPFEIATGASIPVLFGVTPQAAAGSFTVSAQGTSGALSHSATLGLTVQASAAANLPRTAYVRTDSVPAMDDPPNEAHHRHMAYDPANNHLFVANRAMNRVNIFSTVDQTAATPAFVDVPGASSADLSVDGSTVWIGTVTEQIVAIDTISLRVKARYSMTPYVPAPGESYARPEEVVALVTGNCLLRLRGSSGSDAVLTMWNSATNTLMSDPAAEQYGQAIMARTGDRAKVLLATNNPTGDLVVLDSGGSVVVGPVSLGAGASPLAAANVDGSLFAVQFVANGGSQILLLDASLNRISAVSSPARGLTFSRDGSLLYVSGNSAARPTIQIFDGRKLAALGEIPDAAIQGVLSEIEDVDDTHLLFAIGNRGVSFLDAASCATAISGCVPTLPALLPAVAAAPAAQPSEGPAVGGTAVNLLGQNFEAGAQVLFGRQLGSATSVVGATLLQSTSPPSVLGGSANISAYFPGGGLAIAPDAFSYGPQILQILPNGGSKGGGEAVQMLGYGFGSDPSVASVSIGGASAVVQKIENESSVASSLGLDTLFPFPLQRITVQTPPGNPGNATITVTSTAGTVSQANAFQYLQSIQTYTKPGLYKFLLYDAHRQFVYLSATDHVDVFDLHAGAFKVGGLQLYCPSRALLGPCPDADVRGMALTSDSLQLVVADWGSQNIFLLNPDSPGSVSFVPVNIPGYGPARVAATSTQKIFVALSAVSTASGTCAACLAQLDLTASPPIVVSAPQAAVSSLNGTPILQSDSAGDRVFLSYNAAHGGPIALWNAAAPNDFTMFAAGEAPTDVAVSADGTMFAAIAGGVTEIRDAGLAMIASRATPEREQIASASAVPGIALHPSGALVYQPFLDGPAPPESSTMPAPAGLRGGIDIVDAHSGRLRLRVFLPEPLAAHATDVDALHAQFLAVDETGERIFALTTSGLTVVQLANAPLGIGTVTPSNAPAAGGAAIVIRGSGFQSSTAATIGGKKAAVTFKDSSTITLITPALSSGPQQLVLTNANGESYSLDAAFTAN